MNSITSEEEAKTRAVRAITNVVLNLVLALIVLVAVRGAFPDSAVRGTRSERDLIRFLLPEGWAFFTRDPQELSVRPYLRGSHGSWRSMGAADVRGMGLGGIDRAGRLLELEVATLERQIPKEHWRRCRGPVEMCVGKLSDPLIKAQLKLRANHLCGDVALQKVRPVPWAWRDKHSQTFMNSMVVRLTVLCPESV